jgi:hypothetical protein
MVDEKPTYAQINRKVWNTCQFRSLSKEARELFFYLTTCPHGNMLGIFVLRPGYALDDLQWGTDRESFLKPFKELLDKHLFKYDSKTDIILDMEQIVKHPPINPNQVTAAIKIINSLPKTPLFQNLKLLVESLDKPFLKPLTESLGKRYTYTVTETEAVPEAVPEAVTEIKRMADTPFELPSKEQINEAAEPLILEQIEKISKQLYDEKIFPEVNAFKNSMLKAKKNHRSILHTLCRAYMKREFKDGPWAYCQQIIKNESQNYNARDYAKTT